jgi:uncharacterized protein YyaL (SSP411 family)
MQPVVRLRAIAVGLVVAGVAAATAWGADPPPLPQRSVLVSSRTDFRSLAEQGLAKTRQVWWNSRLNWWNSTPNSQDHLPLASVWTAYPLFEAYAAVAIAHPTPANKRAINDFALRAEKYWDPTLAHGHGGFAWYYTVRNSWNAYFDDNGWLGLAYVDAYRATKQKRWLADAARALKFIDDVGWDKRNGGIWWDTDHHKKTSEPLAAGALIAAQLYRYTHQKQYLQIAQKYIAWADKHTWVASRKLYGRNATDDTVMDYVEGMFVAAHVELCESLRKPSLCAKATALANASLNAFPIDANWSPETDVVYLRWLLDLYSHDHNPRWYAVVYRNAQRALTNARDDQGLWLRKWDGSPSVPGALYIQAATLQLFGWLATVPPPSS